MILGVISDTHGAVSREALAALKGAQAIIHAGDIGGPDVMTQLERIAPIAAVLGNTDGGSLAGKLPITDMLEFDGRLFYVLHDLNGLDLDPVAAGIQVIISGHTHQPMIKHMGEVLYFNPGSASLRRNGGPLSVGRITVSAHHLHPEIIQLSG